MTDGTANVCKLSSKVNERRNSDEHMNDLLLKQKTFRFYKANVFILNKVREL